MEFGRRCLPEWPLDPQAIYLNHGTVGVTPRRVMDVRAGLLQEMERHPSRFVLRELTGHAVGHWRPEMPRLRRAAAHVAGFVGAQGDELVFVDNITTGANAVLRSFPFSPGDEILVSDLGYGGVTRAAQFAARTRGAVVRTVTMPYPFTSDALLSAWSDAVGAHTRLAIVDHITANTAVVQPLAAIARVLKSQGVHVLADGAHVPGAIPLDIPSLGVDWYVANLHKWAWTPRSSGFLWAPRPWQDRLHAPVTSWGLDEGFHSEFDSPGTRDATTHLAAPAALDLLREWGGGAIMRYNHDLAWQGAQFLAHRWGTTFSTPEASIGTMATVPVPESIGTTQAASMSLRDALYFEDGIEVHTVCYRDRVWIRFSAQIYNDMSDLERLAEAVLRRT